MAARAECLSLPRRVSGIVGLGLRLLDAGSAQHGEKSQALWSEGGNPREDRGDATPRNRGDAESPLLTLAGKKKRGPERIWPVPSCRPFKSQERKVLFCHIPPCLINLRSETSEGCGLKLQPAVS